MNKQIEQAYSPERLYTSSPSRLSDHMRCARLNFFSNILKWRPDRADVHPETGTAMHLMFENILQHHEPGVEWSEALLVDSFEKFMAYYRRFFPAESDVDNFPKNPDTALKLLIKFRDIMYPRLREARVAYTEVSGSVPVTDKYLMNFRIDTIIEDARGFGIVDFKSASQDSKANRSANHLKPALGTYIHAVESVLEGLGRVWGAEFVLCVFKKEPDVIPIPIIQTPEMMLNWHWHVSYYLKTLEWNFDQLSKCTPDMPVMTAFPQNGEGCTKYGLCKFWDICWAWPNPLQYIDKPPLGFKVHERTSLEDQRPPRYRLEGGVLVKNENYDVELKNYENKVVEDVEKISSLGPQLYSNSLFE